jgi:hypothetical protein
VHLRLLVIFVFSVMQSQPLTDRSRRGSLLGGVRRSCLPPSRSAPLSGWVLVETSVLTGTRPG